jgi:hypothetical protein
LKSGVSKHELDFLAKVEKAVINLEVKNKIPMGYGAPLRRLKEQLAKFAGNRVLVVGGAEVESIAFAEGYLMRAGLEVGSGGDILIINGLIELAKYFVVTYGSKCLDL